jgi:hypothetical protein
MSDTRHYPTLRTPAWVGLLLGVVTVGYAFGVAAVWLERGSSLVVAGMLGLAAFLLVGLVDALITRFEMREEVATLRSLRGSRAIRRGMIAKVGWERGVGVHLHLIDGATIKLPYLGSSVDCTNSIRAWLKEAT